VLSCVGRGLMMG